MCKNHIAYYSFALICTTLLTGIGIAGISIFIAADNENHGCNNPLDHWLLAIGISTFFGTLFTVTRMIICSTNNWLDDLYSGSMVMTGFNIVVIGVNITFIVFWATWTILGTFWAWDPADNGPECPFALKVAVQVLVIMQYIGFGMAFVVIALGTCLVANHYRATKTDYEAIP